MNRNRTDNERTTRTTRIVTLDFNGGSHVYRNPELGMNIPVRIAPSGISADRARMLAEALNRDCVSSHVRFEVEAASSDNASAVRIGRTADFDRYGAFLGLAEGIGSGDAYVLLDDSASDAELVDVIRHEAGHILGTLDHGGAGLVRYASFSITHNYSRAYVDEEGETYRQYLKTKTTSTSTGISSSPSNNDSISVGAYEDSLSITYEYGSYKKAYDEENYTWYWPDPPETEYIEDNYTYNAISSLSGVHAKYRINNSGGTITSCTAQDISVSGKAYRDHTLIYGFYNGESSYSFNEYSEPRLYRGVAEGCTSTVLEVFGYAYATDCKAARIEVSGSIYPWFGWLGESYEYRPNGDYLVYHALIENCTVTGTRGDGTYWSSYDYETGNLSGYYSSELVVDFGATANHVTVQSARVKIGNGSSAPQEDTGAARRYAILGKAVVNDLVVDGGDVYVYYGGELHNANIKGTLRIADGALLDGTINTTRVELSNVVPTTTITIKLDLRDFAVASYSEWKQEDIDEHNYVRRKIEYFANYTARITEYTCYRDKDGDVRYDDVKVTYDTFDNKDGRFDMRDWKYTFEADLGSVDATAMPYIVVDFGGTEKMFDSGKLTFSYPSTTRDIQFQMNSNELKWEEQWSDGDAAAYTGTILYDASLYGEAADVLWLEFGEDPEAEYTVELAPEMAGSTEITAVTVAESGSEALPDARIQGATLVVKGDGVQSGELVVKAEDSAHLDHECALELLVVPEEIPVIGKLGAKKYAEMLKKAQKDHITTTINDILPYNIHTEIFGSKFDLTNMGISLTVDWTEPSIELKLQGKMEWELGKGTAGTGKQLKLVVDFSGDNNYISITHEKGKYSWDIVGEIKAPDFKIGKFAFSNMVLKVNKGEASFSASAYVQLPWIKYSFGGSIGIVDGYLDSMAIGVDSLNIPLGGTGLFLQKIEGGIKGIATELNLSFEGTLGLTAGPKFKVEFVDWLGLDNGVYSLCEMTLTGSISTAGDLEGSSSFIILGGLATGSGSASLKGGELTVKGTYTFLNGCISVKGELHASTGGITIEGTGTATVPREKYFGPLAGYSMSANVAAEVRTSASDSFVMAWQIISVLGNEYTIGFKSNFEGKVSMLGSTDLLKKEEMDSSLRSLRSISVPSASLAAPLRGEATPSASEKYLVSDSGLTFFQVYLSVSGASMSLAYGDTEYTQADIAAGNCENMQIVSELSGETWITVAVDNAALGEWTINAYGDAAATFGAYTLTSVAAKPIISAVEVGEGKRTATIRYTLGDLSAAENATISVFRADGDSTGYTGARIAEFAAAEATGVFEYAPGDDLPGGSYSFYLMVTSDNLAPSYSDRSAACVFLTIDTEAPDQIQVISSEWKSTGTVISWEEPWDDQGIAGYKIRYAIEENVTAEPGDAGDEGTGETGGEGLTETGGEGLTETGGEGTGETGEKEMTEVDVTTNSFTFDKVPNGTYDFQVAAYDAAGNLSAWSEHQSCLVFTVANATYKDLTLAEPLKLDEYESAVNITSGDFSITTSANSLLSGSTVGNAEISGILDDSTVTGKAVLLADGAAYAVTVKGKFEIQGTADGVTVVEGGSLLIGKGAVAKNITVKAGGAVTLQDGAEYAGLVMDYGSSLIVPDGNTYRLTGDIRTAGTLSARSFIFANGHKIRFEQYRQTNEISNPGTTYERDDVAFVTDFDKLGIGVLEIEIDTSSSGNYKIADKVASFNGTITVVDHATGASASVGFDDYTLVGGSLCKLSKISTGAYSTSSLYLLTQSAAVDAPTITVTDAESDLKDTITVTAKSPCAKRTYRYSLNEDMSDAVVVTVTDDTPLALAKSGLTADATYYLQAKVESAYGVESPWSETASFTVVPKYVAPPLTVTAEKNGTSSIVLTVSPMETPKYTIDAYEFRYADNPEMEDAVTSTTYWSDSRISRDQLVDGQDYYIQARAKSRGEWGEWGPTLVFNTESYDYDGVTVGDGCEYTELQLNGKKARNITVMDGGSVYGGSAVSVDGITLNGGYFGAACPVTDAVVNGGIFSLQSYGSVSDLVLNGGTLDLSYGTLNGATVGADATVTIDGSRYRPTITGTILIRGVMTIDEYNSGITTDASFVFDLGAHESETMRDTAFIDYISPLSSAKSFTVQLDDTPEAGDYRLGSLNGDPFCVSFTLAANDGTVLGVLEPGSKAILHNGLYYSLFTSDTVVCLHVSTDDTPVILGKIKLSKNGTVFTADNRYQNLTVSASDKCDHVLMEEGGQIEYLTVGDGGSVEVCGEVRGATVGNGGKLTMNPGCLLAYSPVDIQKGGEIIVNGGKIETNAWFTIAGTLTLNGALQSYEDNSSTWYTIDHDFTFALDQLDAPNNAVMISNYELVKPCDASFIVSVSQNQAEGKYKLMGNAANFSGSLSLSIVDYGWDTLTVGKESTINGTKYALAVKNKILTLTVGDSSTLDPDPEPDPEPDPDDLTNAPDTGWNDYLWDKKKGWNTNIEEFASNEISGNGEISLDIPGTVDKDGKHNLFGNDGTNTDTGDVARIEVDSAAQLTFSIDSTAAGTFYVYEDGFDKKGNRAQLTVGKVSVKANATTTLKDVCLTAGGSYYVAMVAKNVKKAGTEGLYNVSVTNSTFFVDADDGWNNTAAKGNAVEVEHGTTAIVLDNNEMDGSTEFANFVGFSDSIDYAKLDLASSAHLSFNVKADGAAKFTIWKQDAKGKLTKVGGVTSLTAKNKFTATTKAQFFDVDKYQYYLSMECTDAAKGGSAYYDISVSPNSVFFDSSDNGENNWLYDKKENAVNELMGSYVGTYSETWIDFDYDVYHYDYYNFVGYGDTCDYSEIYVDEEGLYNFKIDTTGKAKFTVYSLTRNSKGKWTQKALGSQTIKDVNGATGVTLKKDVKLSATNDDLRYFVSMQANDTKKSPGVYYNVMSFPTAVSEAAALAMPKTDSLGMTDSLSFGQHNTDAIAGASFTSSLADLDDKSGWQSLLA